MFKKMMFVFFVIVSTHVIPVTILEAMNCFEFTQEVQTGASPIRVLVPLSNGELVALSDGAMLYRLKQENQLYKIIDTIEVDGLLVQTIAVTVNDVIVAGCLDGALRFFTKINGSYECTQTTVCHANPVTAIATYNNELAASISYNGSLFIWKQGENGFSLLHAFVGYPNPLKSVSFLDDGSIIFGSHDGVLHILRRGEDDAYTRDHAWNEHQGAVLALDVNAEGKILSISQDKTMRIWEKEEDSYQCAEIIDVNQHWIKNGTFLDDGSIVSFSLIGGTLRFWEKVDGTYLVTQECSEQEKKITSFEVLTPHAIAVGFDDGSIKILNR